jgi:hypothetical protein
MLMSFFLSVFFSASVSTPGSMYELDGNGKYSRVSDFAATPRLHRSASLPVAVAKVDGNTTDNGDGEWDAWNLPELQPAVLSGRMKAKMKKRQQKRRAPKGTPSATASSSSSCSSAFAPNKRPKRTSAKPINYASKADDDNDDADDADDDDDDDVDDFE